MCGFAACGGRLTERSSAHGQACNALLSESIEILLGGDIDIDIDIDMASMVATLTHALAEASLDKKLKAFTAPRLLVIYEMGYLPLEHRGGQPLFFQLITRYERGYQRR